MAITRRQFVTRLGTMAAAMGLSQTDLTKLTEAFAHNTAVEGLWGTDDWTAKPRVIWVHGAECTGCSTSLLSFYENVAGTAVETGNVSTLAALDIIAGTSTDAENPTAAGSLFATQAGHPYGHRTLFNTDLHVDGSPYLANIADVLIDFISVEYHETVMGMFGDLASKWLADAMTGGAGNYVLVVEGAVQDKVSNAGLAFPDGHSGESWCSIGVDSDGTNEKDFGDVVEALAETGNGCAGVITIGQCASFGGYPACVSPKLGAKQTSAAGVSAFLGTKTGPFAPVLNCPGCPTNPWWFVGTVVLALLDISTSKTLGASGSYTEADGQGRAVHIYGHLLHGKYCPRYTFYKQRKYASNPGAEGCLKNLGCEGLSTKSPCGRHGWNAQQPQNSKFDGTFAEGGNLDVHAVQGTVADGSGDAMGTNCLNAGHPCMGCTETGYPDKFTPFCTR